MEWMVEIWRIKISAIEEVTKLRHCVGYLLFLGFEIDQNDNRNNGEGSGPVLKYSWV